METIKYHPILFSTPMVQAKQEGRKTQTRRTKGLEIVNLIPDHWKYEYLGKHPTDEKNKSLYAFFTVKGTETWFYQKCPYSVGDVLWVRETFCRVALPDQMTFIYKADYKQEQKNIGLWKPSLFMPKQACRIFLKIKKIRVERLQEIGDADSIAEGIEEIKPQTYSYKQYRNYINPDNPHGYRSNWMSPINSFESLWKSINGLESWAFNPFVWVYEFEKIEKPLDFI